MNGADPGRLAEVQGPVLHAQSCNRCHHFVSGRPVADLDREEEDRVGDGGEVAEVRVPVGGEEALNF